MTQPIFQIKTEKETPTEGVFILEPLEQGYGLTIGNALRRVLLTSLPGAAVTFVKIAGVRHQFTTIPGLKEDVVEFILNVKKLRIRYGGDKEVKIKLEASGPGEIRASEIKTPASVQVVNKDLVLGTLADKKSKVSIEMTVEKGYGYSPFEERKSETLGTVPIDALFSPVVRVNSRIEATRVGRMTNFDKLILEVSTDGTISPLAAVKQAAKTIIPYFEQIVEPKKPKVREEEKVQISPEVLKLMVEELALPTRIVNALEKAGYKTIEDLVSVSKKDISKVKNLGTKSIKIIEAALSEKEVEFPQ
ncbi:DNA-directed RNA polymerase subunit alpha [Candidatus Shapirobacteria bacterium CG10_big_fil_rev_8_21_14_0_10_40_9]|uniref:DNA-directed RNA polymerase subunit alpha n=1 Tax=Candidatus Shapirobacteria bacterium CG10_big_fil_rev_8_21_14_0_10_40_9 TaxID=1974888 RepID=A0A2M8L3G9_9BACT|nr:MAG: DNA-directed RNA polymerase subunit alpha [Candidatus Shapirobacteria bacterium CG10_big_fil_rev_8_21_14_0_10_40_9]